MNRVMFMVGETSGDTLAVELLEAMQASGLEVEAFGAGGPKRLHFQTGRLHRLQ